MNTGSGHLYIAQNHLIPDFLNYRQKPTIYRFLEFGSTVPNADPDHSTRQNEKWTLLRTELADFSITDFKYKIIFWNAIPMQ